MARVEELLARAAGLPDDYSFLNRHPRSSVPDSLALSSLAQLRGFAEMLTRFEQAYRLRRSSLALSSLAQTRDLGEVFVGSEQVYPAESYNLLA